MMSKACSKCGKIKPLDAFSPNKAMKSGHQSACKVCCRPYRRAYYKRHSERLKYEMREYRKQRPGYARNVLLKCLYGITEVDYQHLLNLQGGACAICKTTEPGGKQKVFHVDHCHETGIVRGLLCNKCNIGIGMLRDDATIVRAAADYLEEGTKPKLVIAA